ncbi:MAG: CrcB family protein [Acidimicrobiales bacterium]
MSLFGWAWFVLACMVGAPARYLLDGLVQDHTEGVFPYGTWVVNVTGSFLLGALTGLALYHGLGKLPKTVLGTGFCGAYTTFSTFTFETVRLAEEGDFGVAARNAVLSLFVGGVAAGAGLTLAML